MTGFLQGHDLPAREIELLDAEVFEVPRHLRGRDLHDQTGGRSDPCPFNDPDPEDDR